MNFDPPFDRHKPDITTAAPFGRSRDGQWIVCAEDLPELPIPKHAAVTKDFIEFDGWVFPLASVSKSLLVWLQASFLRWVKVDVSARNREWVKVDESARNREWVNGIVEAFEDGLFGKL